MYFYLGLGFLPAINLLYAYCELLWQYVILDYTILHIFPIVTFHQTQLLALLECAVIGYN